MKLEVGFPQNSLWGLASWTGSDGGAESKASEVNQHIDPPQKLFFCRQFQNSQHIGYPQPYPG
ncbi:hypothetical protein DL95DRAFT_385472 [Leptodontidium sp. 2 PMI_412]|nr:hypothetical protein DL95DRAFT_385472 [Leptodontidium sp. 2 PMI_412]